MTLTRSACVRLNRPRNRNRRKEWCASISLATPGSSWRTASTTWALIAPLADALNTAVSKHSKVVLDTSGVSFADSSFLNLLILAHQAATLFVVGPGPQLQRLFEISGVDALLRVRATVEEAVAS